MNFIAGAVEPFRPAAEAVLKFSPDGKTPFTPPIPLDADPSRKGWLAVAADGEIAFYVGASPGKRQRVNPAEAEGKALAAALQKAQRKGPGQPAKGAKAGAGGPTKADAAEVKADLDAVRKKVKAAKPDQDYCGSKGYAYRQKAPSGKTWAEYVTKAKSDGGCGQSIPQGVDDPHGHHIVMKCNPRAFGELNEAARQILCKYDIDPYTGCENLVISNNRCHSREYAKHVLEVLEKADQAGSRTVILRALAALAQWHHSCTQGVKTDDFTDE